MDELIVGIIGLVVTALVVGYAFLFFTSSAILFSEVKDSTGFTCKYFTGTRVIEVQVWDVAGGCRRVISVGQSQ